MRDPHQALWPWALALLAALTLSGWWAWDLFKAPELDADHPILPMRPPKDLSRLAPPTAGASAATLPQQPSEAPASQARGLSW